jgi:hypothetical protein
MKEKIIDFLFDFLGVTAFIIEVVVLAALGTAPIFLACFINPWWLVATIITLPLAVTIMIRM